MIIDFEKWHGAHNDFIVLSMTGVQREQQLASVQRATQRLCDRSGAGIGADGVIVVFYPDSLAAATDVRIFNQDGSIAQHCGNGVRCAVASMVRREQAKMPKDQLSTDYFEFSMEGRGLRAHVVQHTGDFQPCLSTVDMGVPKLSRLSERQTLFAECSLGQFKQAINDHGLTDVLDVNQAYHVELANEHLVFFVDKAPEDSAFNSFCQTLQDPALGQGINVHWACSEQIEEEQRKKTIALFQEEPSERVRAVSYERGVGRTMACGSGACAIAASAFWDQCTTRSGWMLVQMPGGTLYIQQSEQDGMITLAGPAQLVYIGQVEI